MALETAVTRVVTVALHWESAVLPTALGGAAAAQPGVRRVSSSTQPRFALRQGQSIRNRDPIFCGRCCSIRPSSIGFGFVRAVASRE